MIRKITMLVAAILAVSVFAQAEEPKQKLENSDTVEAIAVDANKIAKEANTSEANASETIMPIAEEKQKPSM